MTSKEKAEYTVKELAKRRKAKEYALREVHQDSVKRCNWKKYKSQQKAYC